ncbi:hypothetical protein D3C71_2011910 [compost metagenome]
MAASATEKLLDMFTILTAKSLLTIACPLICPVAMACAKERAAYLLASVVDSFANSLTMNPTFLKSKALIPPAIRFSSVSIPKSMRGSFIRC